MAMPQVVGATIQVDVVELVPVDVPDAVALASSDDEGDPRPQPRLDSVGHEVLVAESQNLALVFGHSLEPFGECHEVSRWIQRLTLLQKMPRLTLAFTSGGAELARAGSASPPGLYATLGSSFEG
jgi:hypothetical protein